jgi:hypothetical protein
MHVDLNLWSKRKETLCYNECITEVLKKGVFTLFLLSLYYFDFETVFGAAKKEFGSKVGGHT